MTKMHPGHFRIINTLRIVEEFNVYSIWRDKWYRLAMALGAIIYLPSLAWTLGHDQNLFAEIGSQILRGSRPYVDLWDIKPPNIYVIYAVAQFLFTRSEFAIRFADYLSFLVSLHLVFLLV